MTQQERLSRIDRARDMETLSDIARDIQAVQHAEGSTEAERQTITDAVKRKTLEIAGRLGAG